MIQSKILLKKIKEMELAIRNKYEFHKKTKTTIKAKDIVNGNEFNVSVYFVNKLLKRLAVENKIIVEPHLIYTFIIKECKNGKKN